jgi:glycosyltransferase involved in cell wall biosynthesis
VRKRVLLSIQPVAERGGSDWCLVRTVRSLSAAGWTCHVVTPAPSPLSEEFKAAGAILHEIPMRRITTSGGPAYWAAYAAGWPLAVVRLVALGRRTGATVIHSNSLHSWYGWAAAWLLRRPHVWHAREIVVQSRAALALERVLARHFAAEVLAVSAPVADQLPGAPVRVVHDELGPEDGFGPERAGRFREKVGIADDTVLVGAGGRLDTWKGFEVLLEAVPVIRRGRPDVVVVLAGGAVPGKEAYAERLAATAAATDGVLWLGPRRDMPELLADLDLLVLPSTEPEPYASMGVEALASGVPVVATDHGGLPEMLGQFGARAGLLVPPGDPEALARAVVAALPEGPSNLGRRRSREAMREPAGRLLEEFERVVAGPARPSGAPPTH